MEWPFFLGENSYFQLLAHRFYSLRSLFDHWLLDSSDHKKGIIHVSGFIYWLWVLLCLVLTSKFCSLNCLIFFDYKNSVLHFTYSRKSPNRYCPRLFWFCLSWMRALLGLLSLSKCFFFDLYLLCSYEWWFPFWHLLWHYQFQISFRHGLSHDFHLLWYRYRIEHLFHYDRAWVSWS